MFKIEKTLNPNVMKIVAQNSITNRAIYLNRSSKNPLFRIDEIEQVNLFEKFVFIIKSDNVEWSKKVFSKIISIFKSDPNLFKQPEGYHDAVDLINQYIDLALQKDGGSIELYSYGDEEIHLKFLGACSSCDRAPDTAEAIEKIFKKSGFKQKIIFLF